MMDALDFQFIAALLIPPVYLAIVALLSRRPANPLFVLDDGSSATLDMIKTPRAGMMANTEVEDQHSINIFAPRDGSTLQWQKLNAFVGNRRILTDVYGRADRGSVCAILGFSGAGKSVLLETLASRPTFKSRASYQISVDGQSVTDRRMYSSKVAYVAQHETLAPLATVHEAIMFAAVLRNPGKDSKTCKLLTNKLEREFRLERCKHSYIGGYDSIRGVSMPVSGGERRRTSIAVELVCESGVVVIDEATSSLDASSALECIAILAGLARAGGTIITSLHQPSSGVFDLVDYVIIMKHGRVMHAGLREKLLTSLMERGYECPTLHNPADFVLEVAAMSTSDLESDGFFLQSNDADIDLQAAATSTTELAMPASQQKPSVSTQLALLLKRDMHTYVRHRTSIVVSFCVTTFVYTLAGVVYYRVGTYDFAEYQRLQDNLGALTMLMVGPLSSVATPILLNFSEERPRFQREVAVQTYGVAPYVACKVIVQAIITFPEIDLAFLIGGSLTRLRGRLFAYIGVAWLLGLAVAATASLLGALAPDNKTAMSLFPLIFTPQYFFTGFFRPIRYLPSVLRWGQYACALKYAINLAVVEEFSATNCRKHSSNRDSAEANCRELKRLNNVEAKYVHRDIFTLLAISLGFRLLTALTLRLRYDRNSASVHTGPPLKLHSYIQPFFHKREASNTKKHGSKVDGSDDAVTGGLTGNEKYGTANEAVDVLYVSDTA